MACSAKFGKHHTASPSENHCGHSHNRGLENTPIKQFDFVT